MTKEEEFINKYLIIYRQDKWKDGTYENAIESLKLVISEAIAEHEAGKWHYPPDKPPIKKILVEWRNDRLPNFFTIEKGDEFYWSNYRVRWCELPAPYKKGNEG